MITHSNNSDDQQKQSTHHFCLVNLVYLENDFDPHTVLDCFLDKIGSTKPSCFSPVLLLSCNRSGEYTGCGSSSFQLLCKCIHLCSAMKRRTKCLSLWKQYKIFPKILLFLSCIFGSYIIPITFLSLYFHSPVPIRVASLGKSHIADLCSNLRKGGGLFITGFHSDVLRKGMKLYAWTTKAKINKCSDVNLKSFCTAK